MALEPNLHYPHPIVMEEPKSYEWFIPDAAARKQSQESKGGIKGMEGTS
jgi:hypothetical protein